MTREHSPRPGVTWERQPRQVEQVEDAEPAGKPLALGPNRATRRALAREARRQNH